MREAGLEFDCKHYDWIKKETHCEGYAEYYLQERQTDSKVTNEVDATVYQKLNEEEKKRSNESAGKILREAGLDFKKRIDYDWIKKEAGYVGYAEYYLYKCQSDSKVTNEADATVYQKLFNIDTVLGTDASRQLYGCLHWTDRWDIIKV